ncbi:MAG: Rpn family recombination-promoting nuclease/putative transposase, partial [Planctomycetota bacterium]
MSIPHQFADRIIREALHDPKNLRDLLEFVLGNVAFEFDYDSVEYVDCGFLLPDMRGREADLLCRISLRTEKGMVEMCVCVLIEHQSADDHGMPLRMLEYAVCHWRQLWDM